MSASYKIAIVGAGSLRGKELNEALGESPLAASNFSLMDDEQSLGQLDSVADEVTFIQRITDDSFEHVDFTFFTGDPAITRRHWQAAHRAGSSIIDLSGALETEKGVLVRSPWVREELNGARISDLLDLQTPAIVPAHPVSVGLALALLRLKKLAPIHTAAATVLEPASEYGRAGMDELHQQTVSLLSFQGLPKEVYDSQVAFNVVPVFGEAAKANLAASEARLRLHYSQLSGGRLPQLSVQLIHAPVFHGYALSLFVEFDEPVAFERIEPVLSGDHIEVVIGDPDAPSNLTSTGQGDMVVRLSTEEKGPSRRLWIWAALDNLKFAAMNAVACALELRKLRPQGQVQ